MKTKNIFLPIICLLLTLAASEGVLRMLFPTKVLPEYRARIGKRSIDEKNDEKVNTDLFDLDRHLTQLNNQPKTPHPYLGYVYNRTLLDGVNREGFLDSHEFPFKKKPGDFVIGIFGGSFAGEFADYQNERSTNGVSEFGLKLKKLLPNKLRHKNIVLLNFAVAAYKQPQQFISAALFAESLNLAINIEGYNEAVASANGEFPIYYPSFSRMFFSASPERQRYWLDILSYRKRQIGITQRILGNSLIRHSYLVFYSWRTYMSYLDKKIAQAQASTDDFPEKSQPYYGNRPESEVVSERVSIWKKYTLAQSRMLEAQKIPSLFFLHPSRYVPGSKPLSDIEKQMEANPSETRSLILAYGEMSAVVPVLQKQAVSAYDLTMLFSQEKETIYRDSCCHINEKGQELLEKALLNAIAARIR